MARRKPAPRARKSTPLRTMLKSNLHLLIYTLIHAIFGLYVRLRMAYHAIYDRLLAVLYYHHRTPDLIRNDVKALSRLPEHLSVVLTLHDNGDRDAALEELVNDVGELSAWCASAGIPLLSVYERTGILKSYIPQTHTAITRTLHAYFNPTPPSLPPSLSIRSPSHPSYSPPPSHPSSPSTPPIDADVPAPEAPHLNLLLLSATDGRNTIVDLTKTLADMSQRGKISPSDIGAELVDAEISESVMGEPDLLVVFGPRVVLEGYPPWQVRLTEIFHVPDNSEGVGYQVFLRALHRYAKAQMRFGR
ncbi:hypothetical protein EJ06DRAFT_481900 [Trichodelitschia bisporula]|uniref:ditrans,polycis-polyprenyl diphosphate synthase [(2E,6E)-farnesyldiphosphate specific] n=1 Tax=Trichodelitschia bisporula TaxID=703511 RepID=A0A6G1HN67_9PEZI|nr:hypothetical protein EJ06DRAFT_481900 [Trichodelitschia bisporula]